MTALFAAVIVVLIVAVSFVLTITSTGPAQMASPIVLESIAISLVAATIFVLLRFGFRATRKISPYAVGAIAIAVAAALWWHA